MDTRNRRFFASYWRCERPDHEALAGASEAIPADPRNRFGPLPSAMPPKDGPFGLRLTDRRAYLPLGDAPSRSLSTQIFSRPRVAFAKPPESAQDREVLGQKTMTCAAAPLKRQTKPSQYYLSA
jgi:hypothetical protein